MLVIRGRLTPEQGAVVRRALDAAADRLFREARHAAPPGAVVEEVTGEQRRADALSLIAESALAADLDRCCAGDRYQVVLHVEAGSGAEVPHTVLEVGDSASCVSAETSRRLSCDASVVTMRHDAAGDVLDVGRKTRTVPSAIRRALTAHDMQCQFPGCTARRCDAHHVVHWAEGGTTALDNLLLLCRRHHRLVHEGGYTVRRSDDGSPMFIRPNGWPVEVVPAPAPWNGNTGQRTVPTAKPNALSPTEERLEAAGIAIDAHTAPVWDGTPFNVGYVIDALRGHEPLPPRCSLG